MKGHPVARRQGVLVCRCSRLRLALVAFSALALSAFTSACTTAGDGEVADRPPVSAAQVADIEQFLATDDLNDVQRAALEDFWVSDEEFQHARDQYRACMEPHGLEVSFDDTGTLITASKEYIEQYASEAQAMEAQDDVDFACMVEHLHPVEFFYHDQRDNPEGWTWVQTVRACMDRLGLEEGRDLSDDELLERIEQDEEFLPECRLDPGAVARGEESEVIDQHPVAPGDDS